MTEQKKKPHIRIHIDEGSMCGNVKKDVWCMHLPDTKTCESLNCKSSQTDHKGKFIDYWYELVSSEPTSVNLPEVPNGSV